MYLCIEQKAPSGREYESLSARRRGLYVRADAALGSGRRQLCAGVGSPCRRLMLISLPYKSKETGKRMPRTIRKTMCGIDGACLSCLIRKQ